MDAARDATRVANALDEVAGNICQGCHVIGHHEGPKSVSMTWWAICPKFVSMTW